MDKIDFKQYISSNLRFWTWPPNEEHYVIYINSKIESWLDGKPTIRYTFCFKDGSEKQIDVRSTKFAALMMNYNIRDRLIVSRSLVGKKKYNYAVRYA